MALTPIAYIAIGIIIIAICTIIIIRNQLKKKSKRLDDEISLLYYGEAKNSYDKTKESHLNEKSYADIEDLIDHNFVDHIITATEKEAFTARFQDCFNEAYSFLEKLNFFHIEPTDNITKLVNDFGAIPKFVRKHNENVIQKRLEENKDFFDHCLNYPLDQQQRRSIISEENNCLVVSSAGSGKTSSIVGKVKYLVEKKGIAPQRILLISYTNKAAVELTERMGMQGLRGYTFHKLAIDIIGKATGQKPSICDNTDVLFINIYHKLLDDKNFQKSIVSYLIDFQTQESEWERNKYERQQNLTEQKEKLLKALLPDMGGNAIYVKSEQEQKICFVLSSLGVKFRYEAPYEHLVSDEMHSQYKPDFSIYFEKDGKQHRIYLEHFGIDEHGLVPLWFAKDKNITYEEANKQYGDGITWKKALHSKFGTKLITTSSADFHYLNIREKLKVQLSNAGVPVEEKTEDELYEMVLPQNSKQEKAFIRLVATFITLLKCSCKDIQEVLDKVIAAHDERSAFIIKNIFLPVYNMYVSELKHKGQIDFTDAILQATQICRTQHPVEYDYIIVDEFQDISVDRYNFLKALRENNPPAKMYCVGDDWQSIYRFSGSDMVLFSRFADYFGPTEINKIETTYRFGEPLVSMSSKFIQSNKTQVGKNIQPYSKETKTELRFYAYERNQYCDTISKLVASIPADKSIFLLGRYSFDDYYLSFMYKSVKEGNKFYYVINNRKIEFLTVHKSKGLEADYVIILQCNKDIYGFPSQISDDPVLDHVLTKSDKFPYGEERRIFYVAITRAKIMTIVLYDKRFPSVFVDEFLNPSKVTEQSYMKHPNANKKWTKNADNFLMILYKEGRSIKYIANKMGRSQTSIVMRLGKLGVG